MEKIIRKDEFKSVHLTKDDLIELDKFIRENFNVIDNIGMDYGISLDDRSITSSSLDDLLSHSLPDYCFNFSVRATDWIEKDDDDYGADLVGSIEIIVWKNYARFTVQHADEKKVPYLEEKLKKFFEKKKPRYGNLSHKLSMFSLLVPYFLGGVLLSTFFYDEFQNDINFYFVSAMVIGIVLFLYLGFSDFFINKFPPYKIQFAEREENIFKRIDPTWLIAVGAIVSPVIAIISLFN